MLAIKYPGSAILELGNGHATILKYIECDGRQQKAVDLSL